MKVPFAWEALDAQTLRAKTVGGWIIRYHSRAGTVSMTFVPDPKHSWEVEVPPETLAEAKVRLTKLEEQAKDPYREESLRTEMEEEITNLRHFLAGQQ